MTTREYKWITPNPCTADAPASVHFERNITEAGAEGWEIVAFDGPLRAFAKRPRLVDDPASVERKPSSLAGYVTDESGAAVRTWNQMVAAEHGLPPCPVCGAPAVRQHQNKYVFEHRVACSAEACKTCTVWACNSAQADLYWREMCPPEGSRLFVKGPLSRTVRPPIEFTDDEAPADIAAQAHGKGQEQAIADVAEWLDLLWTFDEDNRSYTNLAYRLRNGTWLKGLERLRLKEKT